MASNILTISLLASALVATACPVQNASAFVSGNKTPKVSRGYHLDGFRGWSRGYHVVAPGSDVPRIDEPRGA